MPIDNPASAAWDLRISQADLQRLRAGLEPRLQQDDKWRVTSEMVLRTHIKGRPNRAAQAGPFPGVRVSPGIMVVRIIQSWTGNEVYMLGVRPIPGDSDQSDQGGGGIIEAITWNEHPSATETISEDQAKTDVTTLCRSILSCAF